MKAQHAMYSFLCGAAIGAAAALLFAPAKGKKTRKNIRKAIKKEQGMIMDMVGSISPKIMKAKEEFTKNKDMVENAVAKEVAKVTKASPAATK